MIINFPRLWGPGGRNLTGFPVGVESRRRILVTTEE